MEGGSKADGFHGGVQIGGKRDAVGVRAGVGGKVGGFSVEVGVGTGGASLKEALKGLSKGRFFKEGPYKSIKVSKEF